ncbi:rhomboid family intramembrane serine protease [Nonomuraea sediminis]|uniref:rhomboid family intramembrane serine protease n=1 Tax=Nonomuraea sediminis TaxID=2835864 RepID=UPI001BDCFEDF|nr:rhomboid family intramembrane serine protease [Nonomuraea sediminis]
MSRVPLASIAVVAVTAVPSLLQFAVPGLEPALMRDPAAIAGGQWWRLVTALVVQDGGLFGTVFNLLTLAALAFLAERTLGPARMLLLYATGAVVGEITGYVLGVAGAGNSITVCALAGGLAVGADRLAASVAAFYAIVMAVSQLFPDAPIALAVVAAVAFQLVTQRARVPAWAFPALAAVAGLVLAGFANLHGLPVLAGMLAGWLVTARRTRAQVA